jgi:hypothetical protein
MIMKSRTIIYCVLLIITALLISFNAAIGIFFLEAIITFTISSTKELVDKIKAKEISTSPFSMFLFIFWFQVVNYALKYIWIGISWLTDSLDKGLAYIFSIPSPKVITLDPMPTMFEWLLKTMNTINTSTSFKDLEENILILIFLIVTHLALTVFLTCSSLMFINHIKQQIKEDETKKEEITEVV